MTPLRSRLRPLPLALAALVLVGLAGCAALPTDGIYRDGRSNRYPDRTPNRGSGSGSYDARDYRTTGEYRRAAADADRYANTLDRPLDLSGQQESAIQRTLRDRTHDLLRRTHPRDHNRVYPFPRNQAERTADGRRWWDATDDAIARMLNSAQRQRYRNAQDGYGYRTDRRDDDRRDGNGRQVRPTIGPARPDVRPNPWNGRGQQNGRGHQQGHGRGNDDRDRNDDRRDDDDDDD